MESGSSALRAWARTHADDVVSSDLLRTELMRATRRGAPEHMRRAREVPDSVTLVSLAASTFEHAAEVDPPSSCNLDALHLAAAMELGDELDGFVCYDERLTASAELHGIAVIASS